MSLAHLLNNATLHRPDSSIILDCGEGTEGQIHRIYGTRAGDVFKRIKAIGITHLHADHHLGLIGILLQRRRYIGADDGPVQLLAPTQISGFLNFYDYCIEPIAKDYNLISNNALVLEPLKDKRVSALGLLSIQTCLVHHCLHAYGFSLTIDPATNGHSEPIKITYSGDTLPCQSLVGIGQNSTVLIHEATMDDSLAEEARLKAHSTTSQALEQAHRMSAKYTILTHFSQRYAKIPIIPDNLKNVAIAFDCMEVVLSDFSRLDSMYAPLKVLFSDAVDDLTRKQMVKALKRERELQG